MQAGSPAPCGCLRQAGAGGDGDTPVPVALPHAFQCGQELLVGCSARPSRSRAGLQAQLLEAIAPEGTSEHRGDTRALGRAPQAPGLCTGLRCSCRGTNSHLLHSCHRANLPDKLLLASKIQAGKPLFTPYNQPEPILPPHVTLPSHPTPPQLGTGAVQVHGPVPSHHSNCKGKLH